MNRNRMIIGLTVAVIVALFFSSYVYRVVQRSAAVKAPGTRKLVVADRAMQLGTRLDASNLSVISWPSDEPIPGAFSRIEDCIGRAVITPVTQHEPILEGKLAPREAGAGLPAAIPEGMRAVSVAVNEVVGVAGFVIPGTMVDVLVTGQLPGGKGAGENYITRTVLENVKVLAAGQKVEQDRDGKPQTVPVVTLLVSPDAASKLTMAATEGKIQLALRNTIDAKVTNPAPVLQGVLFAGPAAAPAHTTAHKPTPPSRPSLYIVEVITGGKKETKSFENQ
jgi:pilus assembly protein CpaB